MKTTQVNVFLLALVTAGVLSAGCSKKDDAAPTTAPVATTPIVVPTVHRLIEAGVLDAAVEAAAPKPNTAKPAWCSCATLQTKVSPGGCFKSAACTAPGVQGWFCQQDGKTCACGPTLQGCQ